MLKDSCVVQHVLGLLRLTDNWVKDWSYVGLPSLHVGPTNEVISQSHE